jgi:hypothetical protein
MLSNLTAHGRRSFALPASSGPGLAIFSATEAALQSAESLVARCLWIRSKGPKRNWSKPAGGFGGSRGSSGTVLARDIDRAVFEFVERK